MAAAEILNGLAADGARDDAGVVRRWRSIFPTNEISGPDVGAAGDQVEVKVLFAKASDRLCLANAAHEVIRANLLDNERSDVAAVGEAARKDGPVGEDAGGGEFVGDIYTACNGVGRAINGVAASRGGHDRLDRVGASEGSD